MDFPVSDLTDHGSNGEPSHFDSVPMPGASVQRLTLARTLLALLGMSTSAVATDGSLPAKTAASLSAIKPLPLLSRGLPVFADNSAAYEPPSYANDANYNTDWVAGTLPDALYFDLSSVPAANRQTIVLVWYNDGNFGYDNGYAGYGHPASYNNVGAYTIEANAAPGGKQPPQSGWIVLATVNGNALLSREHVLPFSGYNWVRMNISATAPYAATTTNTAAINVDIYGASNGVTDGWFFAGDSITAMAMKHGNPIGGTADSFGNQTAALTGFSPPIQENAGMPYLTSGGMVPLLADYLSHFPGPLVTLNFGTNDAADATVTGQFTANMTRLIEIVLASGKIPVIPTIPWTCEPTRVPNVISINKQTQALYARFPQVLKGPDLYAFFADPANQPYVKRGDCLHPDAGGQAAYRVLWASWAASAIYGK